MTDPRLLDEMERLLRRSDLFAVTLLFIGAASVVLGLITEQSWTAIMLGLVMVGAAVAWRLLNDHYWRKLQKKRGRP